MHCTLAQVFFIGSDSPRLAPPSPAKNGRHWWCSAVAAAADVDDDDNDSNDDGDRGVLSLTFASAVDTGHVTVSALTLETAVNVDALTLTTHVVFQTFVRVYAHIHTLTGIKEHTDTESKTHYF